MFLKSLNDFKALNGLLESERCKLLPIVFGINKSCTTSIKQISSRKKTKEARKCDSRRKVCPVCTKCISKKTKHPPSACAKYYKRSKTLTKAMRLKSSSFDDDVCV